jgi:hypothetical protein
MKVNQREESSFLLKANRTAPPAGFFFFVLHLAQSRRRSAKKHPDLRIPFIVPPPGGCSLLAEPVLHIQHSAMNPFPSHYDGYGPCKTAPVDGTAGPDIRGAQGTSSNDCFPCEEYGREEAPLALNPPFRAHKQKKRRSPRSRELRLT